MEQSVPLCFRPEPWSVGSQVLPFAPAGLVRFWSISLCGKWLPEKPVRSGVYTQPLRTRSALFGALLGRLIRFTQHVLRDRRAKINLFTVDEAGYGLSLDKARN
jgi:hypothetical protein